MAAIEDAVPARPTVARRSPAPGAIVAAAPSAWMRPVAIGVAVGVISWHRLWQTALPSPALAAA